MGDLVTLRAAIAAYEAKGGLIAGALGSDGLRDMKSSISTLVQSFADLSQWPQRQAAVDLVGGAMTGYRTAEATFREALDTVREDVGGRLAPYRDPALEASPGSLDYLEDWIRQRIAWLDDTSAYYGGQVDEVYDAASKASEQCYGWAQVEALPNLTKMFPQLHEQLRDTFMVVNTVAMIGGTVVTALAPVCPPLVVVGPAIGIITGLLVDLAKQNVIAGDAEDLQKVIAYGYGTQVTTEGEDALPEGAGTVAERADQVVSAAAIGETVWDTAKPIAEAVKGPLDVGLGAAGAVTTTASWVTGHLERAADYDERTVRDTLTAEEREVFNATITRAWTFDDQPQWSADQIELLGIADDGFRLRIAGREVGMDWYGRMTSGDDAFRGLQAALASARRQYPGLSGMPAYGWDGGYDSTNGYHLWFGPAECSLMPEGVVRVLSGNLDLGGEADLPPLEPLPFDPEEAQREDEERRRREELGQQYDDRAIELEAGYRNQFG